MFCTQCGTQVNEKQKFCTNCGADIEPTTSRISPSNMSGRTPLPGTAVWQSPSKSSSPPALEALSEQPPAPFVPAYVSKPMASTVVAPPKIAAGPRESDNRLARRKVSPLLLWGGIGTLAVVAVVTVLLFLHSRTQPQAVSDAEIEKSIQAKFAADPDISKCTVEARSQAGVVTLTGLVNKPSDRSTADSMARQQAGVKTVVDNLVLPTTASQVGTSEPVGTPVSTPSDSTEPAQSGLVRTVSVPGTQPWTATGIFLNAGAIVQVSASGGVSFSRGSQPAPPAGDPPDCLTVANGPYGWRAAPYVANQLPCSSLLGRVGENGVVFYVGAGTTFRAATPGQLYLGVNDNNFGDNSGFWSAEIAVKTNPPSTAGAAVKTNPPSTAGAQQAWLGFANGNVAQDRDAELRRNCGDFKRVYVPDNAGNKFTDLCGYVRKTCEKVCDWQGSTLSCDAVSQGGNRDGTRIAFCR